MASKKSNNKPVARPIKKAKLDKGSRRRTWFMRILAAIIWVSILGLFAVIWFGWDIPNPKNLSQAMVRPPAYEIRASDQSLLLRAGQNYGKQVKLDKLPDFIPNALLAIEDHRFYYHFGIDPIAISRAVIINFQAGGTRQGGSTLTQQVAKTLFLSPDRNLRRKVQEAMLAIWLEFTFSKQQILEIYMSRVYMGDGNWGFEAAAQSYFDTSLDKITLIQAAMLAGLPQAPSRLNPRVNPNGAHKRAILTLTRMEAEGWINQQQLNTAKAAPIGIQSKPLRGSYSHSFANYALDQALDLMAGSNIDLVIETTLNPRLQAASEASIAKIIPTMQSKGADELALIALGEDGGILSMIGGKSSLVGGFNRTTQAQRQPGSAFKLFVYLAALEAGYQPNSMVIDRPIQWQNWQPQNYGGSYQGSIELDQAFAQSVNTIAASLAQEIGIDKVIAMAKRLGITSKLEAIPSLSLGTSEVNLIELTNAYGVIAAGGHLVEPFAIKSIKTKEGKLLYQAPTPSSQPLLSEPVVRDMKQLLQMTVQTGTAKKAQIEGLVIGGKTGTSQDYRDAWFIGMVEDGLQNQGDKQSPSKLTLGIWMGNDNNQAMKNLSGGSLPVCLWHEIIQTYDNNTTKPNNKLSC